MRNYLTIRKPKMRNIKSVVHSYNTMKGRGIEIFYNLFSGKLFIADYFRNCNKNIYRKVPCVSNHIRFENITIEYVLQEIEKIKQNELDFRINEKNTRKENIKRYRKHRRESFLKHFKR